MLIASYFVSFLAVGRPDSGLARAVSFFPATAPIAMPNRIAMGSTAWWEPVAAAALTLVAIAGLVQFAGRVYTRAVLHGGPALKLRDAWRGTAATGTPRAGTQPRTGSRRHRVATRLTPAMKPMAEVPVTRDVATCTARRRAAYCEAEE
jgi:ABC-2 type transport system permease protein